MRFSDYQRMTTIFIFFMLFLHDLHSQSKSVTPPISYKNEVFGEILGTGGWNSINYGKTLFANNQFSGMIKAGVGYFPRMIKIIQFRTLSANIEFKFLYGGLKNQIELGIGHTYIYFFSKYIYAKYGIGSCCAQSFLIIPRIGYRRYFLDGKLFLSLAYTPVYEYKYKTPHDINTFGFDPLWGGIGIGLRF